MRIDRLKIFLDSMGGGAWPFLVGGVICLVNSVNERDLSLLTSSIYPLVIAGRCLRVVLPLLSSSLSEAGLRLSACMAGLSG